MKSYHERTPAIRGKVVLLPRKTGVASVMLAAALLAGSVQAQYTMVSPIEEQSGYFGKSVDWVADITGDGSPEIVVGANGEDPDSTLSQVGRAHLFTVTGTHVRTFASPNEEQYGNFGWAVAGLDNVGGNSSPDIAVSAYQEDKGVLFDDINVGHVYVFDGSDASVLQTMVSPTPKRGGYFGYALDRIPDVTGDGKDDLLVGALFEDGSTETYCGRAHIMNPVTGLGVRSFESPNQEYQGFFGCAVGSVPDVTGDGIDDVVVGAYYEDPGISPSNAGCAYVFDAATGSLVLTLLSPNEEQNGAFGASVAGIEDLNGDGKGEVLVGAYAEDVGYATGAGRAYLFDGSTGAVLATFEDPDQYWGSRFGFTVSSVPDLTADGKDDILIGADYEYDNGHSQQLAGRVHVFDSVTHERLAALSSPNPEWGGYFGCSVVGAELDTSMEGDVIVGASGDSPGASPLSAGRAYVFTSIDSTPPTSHADANDYSQVGGDITGTYTASDGSGSGILNVYLYVKEPGGTWEKKNAVTGGTWSYTPSQSGGAADGEYRFMTVATDNVMLNEAPPSGSDAGDILISYNDSDNSQCQMPIESDGVYDFPATDDLSVSIDVSGATPGGTITVDRETTVSGAPADLTAGNIIGEHLIITGSGLGSFNADIDWECDPAEDADTFVTHVYRVSGGVVVGTYPASVTGNVISFTGVTGFSEWYAGEAGLPIELDQFSIE